MIFVTSIILPVVPFSIRFTPLIDLPSSLSQQKASAFITFYAIVFILALVVNSLFSFVLRPTFLRNMQYTQKHPAESASYGEFLAR